MKLTIKANRILIASEAIDFRKAIDGLCILIAEKIEKNPTEGVYIFYNKARNRIKIIGWHNNGFAMIYKRLEKGTFCIKIENQLVEIDEKQLEWLLSGLNWNLLTKWNHLE